MRFLFLQGWRLGMVTGYWCWIIFTKDREDEQLTFGIIRPTCFLVCSLSPVKKDEGVWAEDMLGNTWEIQFLHLYACIDPNPQTSKHISKVSRLCANICQCRIICYHISEVTLITPSYFKCEFKICFYGMLWLSVWKAQVWKRKQMMSLTKFSIHCSHSHCSYPSSQLLHSLSFVNGFPVEGSTRISQTIYPKLQENWLQILERGQGEKGEWG